MNELINDEAVYRTAPATPGLLNIIQIPPLEQFPACQMSVLEMLEKVNLCKT